MRQINSSLTSDQVTGIIITTLILLFGGVLAAMVVFSPYHPPTAAQIQQQKLELQQKELQQRQEYLLKMNCENRHGSWDDYNDPGVCKF